MKNQIIINIPFVKKILMIKSNEWLQGHTLSFSKDKCPLQEKQMLN